jgi:hypothetical protein
MEEIGGRRVGSASQDAGAGARSSTERPEFIAAAKCAKSPAVNFMDAIAKVFASTHATDLHRTRGRRSHGWSGWIAPPWELVALQEPSKKHLQRRLALSNQFLTWCQQFRNSIGPQRPVAAHCGQELLKVEARPWLHRSVGDMDHQWFQMKPKPRLSRPTLRPCWRQLQASPRARRKKQGPRPLSRLLITRASGGTQPWR